MQTNSGGIKINLAQIDYDLDQSQTVMVGGTTTTKTNKNIKNRSIPNPSWALVETNIFKHARGSHCSIM